MELLERFPSLEQNYVLSAMGLKQNQGLLVRHVIIVEVQDKLEGSRIVSSVNLLRWLLVPSVRATVPQYLKNAEAVEGKDEKRLSEP